MISIKNRNIVDILLDIMDGEPKPMKNLKVTEKNRNCVDQFWDAHQAEYEARGRQSNDDIEKVNQHNLTYPRLGDELEKRKLLSKVRTNKQRSERSKRPYGDIECAECMKLQFPIQKNRKPKYNQRKVKSRTGSRDIKSIVRKNRYITPIKVTSSLLRAISVNKITKCPCCYVRVKHKRVGSDMSTNLDEKNIKKCVMPNYRMSSSSRIVNDRKGRINSSKRIDNFLPNERMNDLKSEDGEKSSVKTLENPDTSVASLSSYNTNVSMDQEPMVKMEL